MRFALCVDEFDIAKETVDPFLRLAETSGASVDVVHVLTVSTSTGEAWSGSAEQVDERVRDEVREARTRAERELAHITSDIKTPVAIAVVPGTDVTKAILAHCDTQQYDLIGLASHTPREGEGELRIGDIARDVVVGSTAPVCLLYPHPKRTEIIDPEALAEGSFVFTSDGHELGVIGEVREDRFMVRRDGQENWWLPRTALAGAVSGRSELHFTLAAVEEQRLPEPATRR